VGAMPPGTGESGLAGAGLAGARLSMLLRHVTMLLRTGALVEGATLRADEIRYETR
jgi:hypothetical protein